MTDEQIVETTVTDVGATESKPAELAELAEPAEPAKPAKSAAKTKTAKPSTSQKSATPRSKKKTAVTAGDVSQQLDVASIVVREGVNPRKNFDKTALDELAANISIFGVLQPLGVAPGEVDGTYELIWGERRLRAAKQLGLKTVPVMIRRDTTREEQYGMRVSENDQRVDLNPMDAAVAYKNYLTASGAGLKEASEFFGKKQSYISQRIKMLGLPPEVQLALSREEINFSQARELSRLEPPAQLTALAKISDGTATRVKEITKVVEKQKAAKRRKGEKESKPRGRPANTKDKAPNVAQQTLEAAVLALKAFKTTLRAKSDVRDALLMVYERFSNARSDNKREALKGSIHALEWVLGVCDDI